MNNFFANLFKKLKSIKHIEIILAVLFALIILLIYFSSSTSNSFTNNKSENNNLSAISIYTTEVEEKLTNILSKIDGAGNVDVMIMTDNNIDEKEDNIPNIKSVIVVAEGAKNVWVKLEIVKAVEALLNLSTSNIEVLVGGNSS